MTDYATGATNSTVGSIKETVGAATGDRSLQAGGVVDQIKGAVQKRLEAFIDEHPDFQTALH